MIDLELNILNYFCRYIVDRSIRYALGKTISYPLSKQYQGMQTLNASVVFHKTMGTLWFLKFLLYLKTGQIPMVNTNMQRNLNGINHLNTTRKLNIRVKLY